MAMTMTVGQNATSDLLLPSLRAPSSFAAALEKRRTAWEDTDVVISPSTQPGDSSNSTTSMSTADNKVYRIPQRMGKFPVPQPPMSAARRLLVPRPLTISTAYVERAPYSAPVRGRLAGEAATRGISIDVALGRGSRGPSTGDTDHAPPSPTKLPTSAGLPRARGLTVAILTREGGLYAESAPVTPRPTDQPAGAMSVPTLELVPSPGVPDPQQTHPTPRAREVILCRYYHTPGLTCTSSPCRFVHNTESLGLPTPQGPASATLSAKPLLSPRADTDLPDPTSGTFAAAQAAAPLPVQPPVLQVNEHIARVATGEAVAIPGADDVGFVFKMSGGGKGPAGRSRLKFKTVPCKEYAKGDCVYGEYCSFIHDPNNLYDEEKHGKKKTEEAKMEDAVPEPPSGARRTPKATNAKSSPIAIKSVFKGRGRKHSGLKSPVSPVHSQPAATSDVSPPCETVMTPDPSGNDVVTVQVPVVQYNAPLIGNPPRRAKMGHVAGHGAVRNPSPESPSLDSDPAASWDPARANDGDDNSMTAPGEFCWIEGAGWVPQWASSWEEHERAVQQAAQMGLPHNMLYSPTYPLMRAYTDMPLSPAYSWGPMSPVDASGMPMSPPTSAMWSPAWAVSPGLGLSTEIKTKRSYWRTRPCKYFGEGHCPRGETCTFQHVRGKEAPRPSRAGITRGVPCKFFNSASGCTRTEDECQFAHVKIVPEGYHIELPRSFRTRPCRHFQAGRCALGDQCHFAHVVDAKAVKGTVAPPDAPNSPTAHIIVPCNTPCPVSCPHPAPTPTAAAPGHPRSSSAPAASALPRRLEALIAAAFDECPEWAANGSCPDDNCTKLHDLFQEGATGLTDEQVQNACALLRQRSTDNANAVEEDDEDDDEIEIVTCATPHSAVSTTFSTRSL